MQNLAIWTFDWLSGLKDALPQNLISEREYPKVFGWIARFNREIKTAKAKAPKPTVLKGDAAARRIVTAQLAEKDMSVDAADPLGLQADEEVAVWPIDSGFNQKDRGRLVGLTDEENCHSRNSRHG